MRRRVRAAGRRTFRAISVRNYRLYFIGQVISVSGTWMQTVAQAYLILFPLHGTGVDVAIATSLQFLPLLLLGPFGGLIADRLDKRKVLYATQGTAGVLALVLGVLVATHCVNLWEVYVLAAGLGFVNLFDNPARQTFVSEMVGMELLPNAVSLNSVLMNSARVIGPAIGGVLILTVGVATCFFLNAVSFAAVIVALAMMRASELIRRPGVVRARGQVREGLRYVWTTPDLRVPLVSMAVVGVFAFNFTVTLALLAKFTFHGGAGLYSWFLVAMGAGAVVGGLATAFRSRPSTRVLAFIGLAFGGAILAVAFAPRRRAGPTGPHGRRRAVLTTSGPIQRQRLQRAPCGRRCATPWPSRRSPNAIAVVERATAHPTRAGARLTSPSPHLDAASSGPWRRLAHHAQPPPARPRRSARPRRKDGRTPRPAPGRRRRLRAPGAPQQLRGSRRGARAPGPRATSRPRTRPPVR